MLSSRLWIALLGHSHGLWLVSRETTKTDSTRARNMETLSQMYTRIPCTVAQQALGLSESKTVEGIVHPSVPPRVYPHPGAPFLQSVCSKAGWEVDAATKVLAPKRKQSAPTKLPGKCETRLRPSTTPLSVMPS